jgi:hypothetical protein
MGAAGYALPGLVGDLPGGLGDPLGYFRSHAEAISAVTGAGGVLGNIAGASGAGGLNLGAGLSVGDDPAKNDWRVMAGVQGHF